MEKKNIAVHTLWTEDGLRALRVENLETGKRYLADPDHLVFDPEVQARYHKGEIVSTAHVERLARDIAERGMKYPVSVMPFLVNGAMKLIVESGNNRTAAARLLKQRDPENRAAWQVPIEISGAKSKKEAFLASIKENALHNDLSDADKLVIIRRLLGEGGAQKDIAALFGMSEQWVSHMKALGALPEPLMDAMHEGLSSHAAKAAAATLASDTVLTAALQIAFQEAAASEKLTSLFSSTGSKTNGKRFSIVTAKGLVDAIARAVKEDTEGRPFIQDAVFLPVPDAPLEPYNLVVTVLRATALTIRLLDPKAKKDSPERYQVKAKVTVPEGQTRIEIPASVHGIKWDQVASVIAHGTTPDGTEVVTPGRTCKHPAASKPQTPTGQTASGGQTPEQTTGQAASGQTPPPSPTGQTPEQTLSGQAEGKPESETLAAPIRSIRDWTKVASRLGEGFGAGPITDVLRAINAYFYIHGTDESTIRQFLIALEQYVPAERQAEFIAMGEARERARHVTPTSDDDTPVTTPASTTARVKRAKK